MKSKIINAAYWVTGFVHIGSDFLGSPDIQNMSKAALMPLLLFLMFVLANGVVTLPRLLLAAGLIFSWGGDVLLTNKNEELYFLAGLGSFLIAQLIYMVVMFNSTFQKPKIKFKPLLPVLGFGMILLINVTPHAGNLSIPIILYAICVLLMASSAILRHKLTSDDSYQWTLIGAMLFVISDALIGIDKFIFELPLARLFIMGTYIPAQYLIVRGILKHPGG
jgi:uncharacterized membrane protein YhhN